MFYQNCSGILDYNIEQCHNNEFSHIVTHYFTIRTQEPSEEIMRMIPSGRQYILFFVSGSAKLFYRGIELQFRNNVAIGGPRNHCLSYKTTADTYVLGVSLVPNGLYKLYGRNFSKITVYAESLSFLKNNELNKVLELLQSEEKLSRQIEHIEAYLSGKVMRLIPDELTDLATEIINENKGVIKIVDLAQKLYISVRHLEKIFARSVGVTPGKYAKMIRFKYAFEEFSQKLLPPKEVILKYNYVDYSHFLKDFVQYTGEFPKDIEVTDNSLYKAYLKALNQHDLQN